MPIGIGRYAYYVFSVAFIGCRCYRLRFLWLPNGLLYKCATQGTVRIVIKPGAYLSAMQLNGLSENYGVVFIYSRHQIHNTNAHFSNFPSP
jgi:hypothetical protein